MNNKSDLTVTVTLSNGLMVRIPFKNCKETLARMEERLKEHSEGSFIKNS